MKNKLIYFAFAFIAITIFSNCNPKMVINQVTYVEYNQDLLTLRVFGAGKKEKGAMENVCLTAINNVLFRGIPNSNISDPLVGLDEKEAYQKYPKYFDSFNKEKRYMNFITSTTLYTEFTKEKGLTNVTLDVKINITSLRKDLENNGVIKKFGF